VTAIAVPQYGHSLLSGCSIATDAPVFAFIQSAFEKTTIKLICQRQLFNFIDFDKKWRSPFQQRLRPSTGSGDGNLGARPPANVGQAASLPFEVPSRRHARRSMAS
jgi:hypothetical protein